MRLKLLAALLAVPFAAQAADAPTIKTNDVFIPWVSTLPVDAGQVVGLHAVCAWCTWAG